MSGELCPTTSKSDQGKTFSRPDVLVPPCQHCSNIALPLSGLRLVVLFVVVGVVGQAVLAQGLLCSVRQSFLTPTADGLDEMTHFMDSSSYLL